MFAAIYISDFRLRAALRHEPELHSRPVVLLDQESKTIIELTAGARENGISKGLNSSQALARCPGVIIKTRSVRQEEAAMNLLLECAVAFSPNIEATAPGICTLDLKGLPVALATDASQQEWANRIIAQLAGLNLPAQIGVAENPELALHAAKNADPFFFVENSVEFISALPIESIDPAPEILNILQRWGISTVGEFIALQKNQLAERLGAQSLELFERAVAKTVRPLKLVRPKEVFEEFIEFEYEIETLQPLLFILRRFIEQLSRRLQLFYLVAQEIRLSLNLVSGEKLERSLRIPSPTRNIETLFRMLQTHLETVQTDSPVVALYLAAKPARSEHFQFGLFETGLRDPNQFYETLAQLTSLLGTDRVGTPVVEDTFRPDAFCMKPVNFETAATQNSENKIQSPGLSLRRFRPVLSAAVQLRDGKPALLNCEKFVGPLLKADGPFRLSGNWWEPGQLWSREEWEVETANGDLFRIFEQNGHWFLEGALD